MKHLLVWVWLTTIFVLLAWKNPFADNNLIANLEPYPDTLYYSVPAWNFVHGHGFSMTIDGMRIPTIVPPLYGIMLMPLMWIFNDVRSYYYVNLFLGVLSIFLFLKIIDKVFASSPRLILTKIVVGILLVTNFYFYNLPSLLMAENLLIPLTLAAIYLLVADASINHVRLVVFVAAGLLLTKMSALPVIFVLGAGMAIKVLASRDRKIIREGIVVAVFFGLIGGWYLLQNLKIWQIGSEDMNIANTLANVKIYFRQLMGIGSTYLWYTNPLLERLVAGAAFAGLAGGLLINNYRQLSIAIIGVIIAVLVFHSTKSYPEGRYVSTVVPVLMLGVGVLLDKTPRKVGYLAATILLIIYFGSRVTINGFYERKITTLKRQAMNNFREVNETAWNYMAIESFNKFFRVKEDDAYLATLLPAFYVSYFSNGNYKVLPVSATQEFSAKGKNLVGQYFDDKGDSIVGLYEKLIGEGKNVYVSNYYLQNHRSDWEIDYKNLERSFAFEQVADGCMDLCKIYKLKLKNTPSLSSPIKKMISKSFLIKWTRFLFTLGLVVLAFVSVDLKEIAREIGNVSLWFVVGMLAYLALTFVISSIRWSWLLLDKPRLVDYLNFTRATYIGNFYALVLPSSLAGDFIKWLPLLRQYPHLSKSRLAASVIVDKFVGLGSLIIIGFGSLLLGKLTGYVFPKVLWWLFGGLLLGLGVMLYALIFVDYKYFFGKYKLMAKVINLLDTIKKENRDKILKSMALSLLAVPIWVLPNWFYSQYFDAGVKLAEVYIFMPVVSLLLTLPITIAGFGVRENLFLLFLEPLGYATEKILLMSAFGGVMGILNKLLGSVFVVWKWYDKDKTDILVES